MAQQKGKVVVIGATGFVGSYVTRELLKKGIYDVHGTYARDGQQGSWLNTLVPGNAVTLHELILGPDGPVGGITQLSAITKGASGVFMCAGYETQAPETIDVMVNAGLSVLKSLESNFQENSSSSSGCTVVLTSSTGSTNPPADRNLPELKSEITHWSDPDLQQANKRFSPAAKTLMELRALEYIGRNKHNEVVDSEKAVKFAKIARLCIINPSLILAPQLHPREEVTGNGLPWFARIVKREAMVEEIPNDSMSIIHCEDLARIHVACLEDPDASGRYFGVKQSWAWEDIFAAISQEISASYPARSFPVPPIKYTEKKPVTAFDTARRDSLKNLGQLKSLKEIVSDTLSFLHAKGMI